MTVYPFFLYTSGLSIREAATFHDVRVSTIENWSSGRRDATPGAIAELHGLVRRQMRAARETLDLIRQYPAAGALEIGMPSDDHEAQGLGWPCLSAWEAMAGMLLAMLEPDELERVVIVPRGARPATAAAVDAHGR
jgi:hypothetical protein